MRKSFFASRFGRQTKSRLLVTVMEKQTPTQHIPVLKQAKAEYAKLQ